MNTFSRTLPVWNAESPLIIELLRDNLIDARVLVIILIEVHCPTGVYSFVSKCTSSGDNVNIGANRLFKARTSKSLYVHQIHPRCFKKGHLIFVKMAGPANKYFLIMYFLNIKIIP